MFMKKMDVVLGRKIIRKAEKLLPSIDSRIKLVTLLMKEFKMTRGAVNATMSRYGFRTGFKAGMLVPENRYNNKGFERTRAFKLWCLIRDRPLFTFELKKEIGLGISELYKALKVRGFPIQRTTLLGRSSHAKNTWLLKNKRLVLYYNTEKRELAYNRLKRLNPELPDRIKYSLGRAILDGKFNRLTKV